MIQNDPVARNGSILKLDLKEFVQIYKGLLFKEK